MGAPSPIIDGRDFAAILKEARELAAFYTPEWAAREESGAGAALLNIFANMLEGLIRRLNEVPVKNFIAFLDMLGVKLLPAQPARAPLTFALSAGAKEPVVIPARSQAAASPPAGEPIVFETEKPILATPARLKNVFSVVPSRDEIFDHFPDLASKSTTQIFTNIHNPLNPQSNFNLQTHVLYLGDDNLFNIEGAIRIDLKILSAQTALLGNSSLVSWQYFGEIEVIRADGAKEKVAGWYDFTVSHGRNIIMLTKNLVGEIKQIEINAIKSRWIRCRVTRRLAKGSALASLIVNGITVGPVQAALIPDMAFFNDIPLPLPATDAKPLSPFGPRPRQNDVFYIASQEAFSKKGVSIQLSITAGAVAPSAIDDVTGAGLIGAIGMPELSWEYWNGKGWMLIKGLNDGTNKLTATGTVTFTCPDDIELTKVAGQDSYWIRVRISFGDYGQEEIKIVDTTPASGAASKESLTARDSAAAASLPSNFRVIIDTNGINPPQLRALTISYTAQRALSTIVTLNNLQYKSEAVPFSPFIPLEDEAQALYLGFDQPPLKGAISIFFSLEEQQYTEDNRPRIVWEYFRKQVGNNQSEWAQLLVLDETKNLTESGTIEFIGPPDFTQASMLGQSLYWIRAVDVENKFQATLPRSSLLFASVILQPVLLPTSALTATEVIDPALRAIVTSERLAAAASQESCCAQLVACQDLLQTFNPIFSAQSAGPRIPPPRVKGIYLNTAWAIQAQSVRDEILGSSSGTANQSFALTKFPVLEEEVWVNEFGSLTESERKALGEQKNLEVKKVSDPEGKVVEFWIRWQPVDDLAVANATERAYSIDSTFGRVQFGDGINGRVPPIGQDNIKSTYQSGGGASGNVAASTIKTLRTTIPSVDNVTNAEPAGGGSDTEMIESALERGPISVKHRGRAITAQDFEALAREASRSVVRSQCLPMFNDLGKAQTDWVTVIIIPGSQEARPTPSPQLRSRVEKYLRERSANVAAFPRQIKVIGPTYVEVSLSADLYPVTIDVAPQVEADSVSLLKSFLHPLTGGYKARGWDFGRLPCLSDFYALLESVEGVNYAQNLSMALRTIKLNGDFDQPTIVTEDNPLGVEMPEYALVFSGEHKITVKALV
jgi:hypothetical protein